MPRRAREWGALDVKRAAHSGERDRNEWSAVGGVSGLQLQITPGGSKSWLLRTMIGGTRRSIGLGAYPEVSLSGARDKAREAKDMIQRGQDPIEARKVARAALAAARRRNLTFSEAADNWIDAKLQDRPLKSQKAVKSTLIRYALPEIGALSLQEISTQHVVRILAPIWKEKHETAAKLRSYLENILSWATVAGYRDGDNPARWKGNLKELLPSYSAVALGRSEHFPAIPVGRLPEWWAEVSRREGIAAIALRFAALCACRSGEVRGAEWQEVDLDAGVWTIPGECMKMKREHRVPLSHSAVRLLRDMPRMGEVSYVFPSPRGKVLSDMALSSVMRRMQNDAVTAGHCGWVDSRSGRPAVPHGLRSSFRDWAAERGVDRDLAELALAHQVGSAVERAYRRTDMFERRRALMNLWADFLHGHEVNPIVDSDGERAQ